MSNTITAYLTTPIRSTNCSLGYTVGTGSRISSIINSASPITIISVGVGIVGLVVSFLGALNDRATKWYGLTLAGLGIGGLISGFLNDFNNYKKDHPQQELSTHLPQPKHEPSMPQVNPQSTLLTPKFDIEKDLDILVVDLYHAILNNDLDKLTKTIERGKLLGLNELSCLLKSKHIEVKTLALLSLISKEDFDDKTKALILESIKNNDRLLNTLKKIATLDKDNTVVFERIVDLLVKRSS